MVFGVTIELEMSLNNTLSELWIYTQKIIQKTSVLRLTYNKKMKGL